MEEISKRLTDELAVGWEFDARDLAMLYLCDRTAATIEKLEFELEEHGWVVEGSEKQPRLNPIVAELRQQRSALSGLLARINIPSGDEAPKSQQHQAAANARWDRVRRRNG